MVDINAYMRDLTARLRAEFGGELRYVGLQGSYLRGEATQDSDIDVMTVFEPFTGDTLTRYRRVIQSLPHADIACGFTCGLGDLRGWNRGEIAHLLGSTGDYYGCLRALAPAFSLADTWDYVKLSAGNLLHALCHRRLYRPDKETREALLADARCVFFILQDLHYLRTGDFVRTKAALLDRLSGLDRQALALLLTLSAGEDCDVPEAFDTLFAWCRQVIAENGDARPPLGV